MENLQKNLLDLKISNRPYLTRSKLRGLIPTADSCNQMSVRACMTATEYCSIPLISHLSYARAPTELESLLACVTDYVLLTAFQTATYDEYF